MSAAAAQDEFQRKIKDRSARVGIIGLGYVGLPLAREFARAGFRTTGFDIDPRKVKLLMQGKSYIRHLPANTVKPLIDAGKFIPTNDFDQLTDMDAVSICVPTPLTENRVPDMSYIEKTGAAIQKRLRKGQLIVLESTTYPGTTRELLKPLLEQSGLASGKDFFLAFSPEREDPGREDFNLRTIPKLVGGLCGASTAMADALYSSIIERTVVTSCAEVAEAAKILENIYRSVNIAMVNELKILFDKLGINIWEVIDAAKTKPYGFQAFYPGPGLGGHCIPIDPFYLSWKARQVDMSTHFIELAGEINAAMPQYVVNRLALALNRHRKPLNGSKVLILGVAYKKNVDDFRETPAFTVIELLQEAGAQVEYHDPFVPHLESEKKLSPIVMDSVDLSEKRVAAADAVVIVTDHDCIDYAGVTRHAKLVVDSRNATKHCTDNRDKIFPA